MSSGISLLSLTAHGINTNFQKMSIILKCEVMEGRHTGETISSKFQPLFHQWDIKNDAVHCVVRDRVSNMIKAMQLSDIQDFNCSVHQIQRCIRTVTQAEQWLEQLVSKVKRIATHFNHSLIEQEKLRQIQTETLNLSPVQDCPTRWNSTVYMMERFIAIKDSIVLYLSKKEIATITPDDWINVEKYVKILRPFEEVTREFSSSQVTISSVIPLIQPIASTLQAESIKPDTSNDFKRVIKKLIDEINSRFDDLSKNSLCTISTYLDPRYKTKSFNEITKEEVEIEIIQIMTKTEEGEMTDQQESDSSDPKKEEEHEPIRSINDCPQQSQHSLEMEILESIFSSSSNSNDSQEGVPSLEPVAMAKQILREYSSEKRLPLKEDPFKWWQTNAYKYSMLLPLVRRFLSAPPSSVASEQLFSGAALIYDEKKSNLKADKAAKLLFL